MNNINDVEYKLKYLGTKSMTIEGNRILTFIRSQSHSIFTSNEVKVRYIVPDLLLDPLENEHIRTETLDFNMLVIKNSYSFIELLKSTLTAVLNGEHVSIKYNTTMVCGDNHEKDMSLEINNGCIIQNGWHFELSKECTEAIIAELNDLLNDKEVFDNEQYVLAY